MLYTDLSSKMRWRPKEKDKYIIRILPAKEESKASWFLKADKHFIDIGEQYDKVYVCNRQLFNCPCPVCVADDFLSQEEEFDIQFQLRSGWQYVMNIVVRDREMEGVKIWEAPKTAFRGIAREQYRNKTAIYEHDFIVDYNPESKPYPTYKVEMIREKSPIGSEKQISLWRGQMIELLPEHLYEPEGESIDIDIELIKTVREVPKIRRLKEQRKQFEEINGCALDEPLKKLREELPQLIEAEEKGEDTKMQWLEWREKWALEKEKEKKRMEELSKKLDKRLEIDGFKEGDEFYNEARDKLRYMFDEDSKDWEWPKERYKILKKLVQEGKNYSEYQKELDKKERKKTREWLKKKGKWLKAKGIDVSTLTDEEVWKTKVEFIRDNVKKREAKAKKK